MSPNSYSNELANAWATKSVLDDEKIGENIDLLQRYSLMFVSVTFPAMEKTVAFSKQYHVSVYDASYAVLAHEKKCDLITADKKFIKQVNLPFIKHLSEVRV